MKCKRAVTGACIFDIPGPDGTAKASKLEEKLQDVFEGREEIKIRRPTKMAEMRISEFDDSVNTTDIARAISGIGGCGIFEVKVGAIKIAPNGLGTVWLRCPLTVANKVIEGGRVNIGWSKARAVMLDVRPLQCFRCMEVGHVRQNCKSKVDRRTLCYRCGQPGHIAQVCNAEVPRCAVCADAGKPAVYRAGGKACPFVRGGNKKPPSRMGPGLTNKKATQEDTRAKGKTPSPQITDSEDEARQKKRMRIEKEQTATEPNRKEGEVEDPARI